MIVVECVCPYRDNLPLPRFGEECVEAHVRRVICLAWVQVADMSMESMCLVLRLSVLSRRCWQERPCIVRRWCGPRLLLSGFVYRG